MGESTLAPVVEGGVCVVGRRGSSRGPTRASPQMRRRTVATSTRGRRAGFHWVRLAPEGNLRYSMLAVTRRILVPSSRWRYPDLIFSPFKSDTGLGSWNVTRSLRAKGRSPAWHQSHPNPRFKPWHLWRVSLYAFDDGLRTSASFKGAYLVGRVIHGSVGPETIPATDQIRSRYPQVQRQGKRPNTPWLPSCSKVVGSEVGGRGGGGGVFDDHLKPWF